MEDLTRPGWDRWFVMQAHVIAKRGSCRRLRVGALIVRDRDKRVISGGYNGAPRGMPDCLEVGCDLRKNLDGRESCFRTLHAESNALDLAGRVDHEPHTLYVTATPCRPCAMRIVQHGITRVVYSSYYESQGTKEVEAIFAGTDPDTQKAIADRFGSAAIPARRVILEQLEVVDPSVVLKEIYDRLGALSLVEMVSRETWSEICKLQSLAAIGLGRATPSAS